VVSWAAAVHARHEMRHRSSAGRSVEDLLMEECFRFRESATCFQAIFAERHEPNIAVLYYS